MKYRGRLAKPVVRVDSKLLLEEAERGESKLLRKSVNEVWDKLPDLFDVHGVLEDDWKGLAIALARAHVPGFKFVKPAGRRVEWDLLTRAEFRRHVDNKIAESGTRLSVEEAIKHVCRSSRWASFTEKKSLGALTKQYHLADPRL